MIRNIKQSVYFALVILSINSCNNNPATLTVQNRNPIILSVTVFPDTIGPADSAIVICNAWDPDGDSLVYDWITDGRLNLKDVGVPNEHFRFNTHENSQVFYPSQAIRSPIDTPWVEVSARDGIGGSVSKVVTFIVKQ